MEVRLLSSSDVMVTAGWAEGGGGENVEVVLVAVGARRVDGKRTRCGITNGDD